MLPKKAELNKLMTEKKKELAIKAARQAEAARLNAEKKKKEAEAKFKQKVQDLVRRVEEDVVCAINSGLNETEIRFGDGHTTDPAWEKAIANLRKINKDYKFELLSVQIQCDNHGEAANVDGVTAREWWEPMWQLNVQW